MAVKISGIKPTVTCPATLYLRGDDDTFIAHKYTVIFRRLPKSEMEELSELYTTGKRTETFVAGTTEPVVEHKRMTLHELLDRIVHGWGGMLDENGEPVPYSPEERRATEQEFPGLEQSMAVTWFDTFSFHQREAAQKNSVAQSGTTSAETARTAT